jgi:hypothetical protein
MPVEESRVATEMSTSENRAIGVLWCSFNWIKPAYPGYVLLDVKADEG